MLEDSYSDESKQQANRSCCFKLQSFRTPINYNYKIKQHARMHQEDVVFSTMTSSYHRAAIRGVVLSGRVIGPAPTILPKRSSLSNAGCSWWKHCFLVARESCIFGLGLLSILSLMTKAKYSNETDVNTIQMPFRLRLLNYRLLNYTIGYRMLN